MAEEKEKMKQNKKILLGIAAVISIILIIYLYQIYKPELPKFAVGELPGGCGVIKSGTEKSEFTCPGKCNVNGMASCSLSTAQPTVIFRTNVINDNYENMLSTDWIVYNFNGQLKSFVKSGTFSISSSGYCNGNVFTPYRKYCTEIAGTISKPEIHIYTRSNSGISFKLGGEGDISTNPLDQYKNLEVYSGSASVYQCKTDWKIESSGIIKDSGTAVYNSEMSGNYDTGIKTLYPGDKFYFPLGNINYEVLDNEKCCVVDQCNKEGTGVIKCSGGALGQEQLCSQGQRCVYQAGIGKCEVPFVSSINFGSYEKDKPISFDYSISSNTIKSSQITFKLVDIRDESKILDIVGPTTINIPSIKTITFDAQSSVGTYAVIVEKTYDSKQAEKERFTFSVGNPLNIEILIPYSDITSTNILTGSEFYVDIEVKENDILVTDNVVIEATAKLTGTNKEIIIPTKEPDKINDRFRFKFNINEPGKFIFQAKAIKAGVSTTLKGRETDIKEPNIKVSLIDFGIIQNSPPGDLKIKFETKSPYDTYLETSNQVKIIPSGASTGAGDIDVTSFVKRTDTGKYEFNYNFKQGSYIIKIYSISEGYVKQSEYSSPIMNIDPSVIPDECDSSDDCSSGKICQKGKCIEKEAPIFLYLIIGIAGLIVIILVIILVRILRKPKTQEISIGGGL